MSNWGFESPEEWLQLLKLNNLLHIHVKNKNDPWYVLAPISQLLLGQKSKVRTVLKSWQWALFKTDLTFWIWWRFDENIAKNNKIQKFLGTPFNYHSVGGDRPPVSCKIRYQNSMSKKSHMAVSLLSGLLLSLWVNTFWLLLKKF